MQSKVNVFVFLECSALNFKVEILLPHDLL